ncbi:MAG: glycosyltransferase family 39 protein, partial [Planctomycetes bacterium]|nr:glycosyltransferase family 39 protein [Planctomycetota bacterium]
LVALFCAAFLVRAAYVVTLDESLQFADSVGYDALAKNLLAGKGLVFDETHQVVRAPFYPIFLAACYELFGPGALLMPRLIQCAVGAILCLLVFLLAQRVFDERAGMIAAVICVFYPFFIFYTGLILTETFFACALAALVFALVDVRDRRDVQGAAWAGLALGVCVLLRPSMLTFVPFLLPFWIACAGWRRETVKSFVMVAGAVAIVLIPWTWRNYVVTGGKFVPTTLLVGKSLYEANSDYATGGPAMHLVQWPPEIERMSEYDADRYMKAKAVEWIKANPGCFVKLAFVKLGRFWNPFPNFEEYRSTPYLLISLFSFGPVLVFSLWGIWRAAGQWRQVLLLLAPVFYFSLLHSVFVGSIRYRMPVEPFLIVLAGHALSVWLLGAREAPSKAALLSSQDLTLSPASARLRRRLAGVLVVGTLAAMAVSGVKVARQPDWVRRKAEESISRCVNA